MYKEGEYIVYGLNGVCRVESITTLDMKDVPKDVEYYSLIPLGQGGKIYVRVDSAQDKMRPVISKSEAELLIKQIDEIEAIKITNEKTVEELYKSCMRSYDCTEWVRLIKCIYKRKLKRTESGKRAARRRRGHQKIGGEAAAGGISADRRG